MAWYLFINSTTSITLEPEYNFEFGDKKIESEHRMRDGSLFRYKWGDFNRFSFGVSYVNSADKKQINDWWNDNEKLLFVESGSTAVYSVSITNKKLPIGKYMKPYTDLFGGKIELETY